MEITKNTSKINSTIYLNKSTDQSKNMKHMKAKRYFNIEEDCEESSISNVDLSIKKKKKSKLSQQNIENIKHEQSKKLEIGSDKMIKYVKDKSAKPHIEQFYMDSEGAKPATLSVDKHTKNKERTYSEALGYNQLLEKERNLTDDLFGSNVLYDDTKNKKLSSSLQRVQDDNTLDKDGGNLPDTSKIPDDPYDIHEVKQTQNKKSAWIDEDDENVRVKDVMKTMTKGRGKRGSVESSTAKYVDTLHQKFQQVVGPVPEWAELGRSLADDDEDEFSKTTGNYLSNQTTSSLPKTSLYFKKVSDLNCDHHAEGALLKAVEFNPVFQVSLVAGGSNKNFGAVTLFQVDGRHNHKIQSVKFPKYPVNCAKFMQDGRRFVLSSNLHSHFFIYDMEAAKQTRVQTKRKYGQANMKGSIVSPDGSLFVFYGAAGEMELYDSASCSHIATLQAPCNIKAASFNKDGSRMYTHGDSGQVHVWDMNSREGIYSFYDDGCVQGTSIAMSPNGQYLACGSSLGIVNVYDSELLSKSSAPKPLKIIDKLVTAVSNLNFNSSSEILAMSSGFKDDAIRMVHFPSMTLFNNFPGLLKMLRRSQCTNFSPNSGFFATGNNAGAAHLFRIKQFSSY